MALDAFKNGFKEPFFVNAKVGFTKTSYTYSKDSVNIIPLTESYVTPKFTFSLIKVLSCGFNVWGYFALSYNYSVNYIAATATSFTIPFGNTRNYYSSIVSLRKPAK